MNSSAGTALHTVGTPVQNYIRWLRISIFLTFVFCCQIAVALDELLNNIASYAYPQDTGSVTVQMRYNEKSETVSITLIDSGAAYNPLEKADPDVTLAAEDRPIGGLGILMVKKKMDGMECRRENNHNILTIHKRIREE